MLPAATLDTLAAQMHGAQEACAPLQPLTAATPGFDLADGYAVAARVHVRRVAAGAQPRGRKIGFTNANIWPQYNVHAPIWGWVYAHTLTLSEDGHAALALDGLAEPRIEPEIAFGLRQAPPPGADAATLAGCIDWVAIAFEVVQSHFPGWRFQAPDTVADGGLHGRLVLGARVPLAALGPHPQAALGELAVSLACDGRHVETGHGRNVLGGPLAALAHLVGLLHAQGPEVALRAGEVVTTGTVTAAYPVQPGQCWTATPAAGALPALQLALHAGRAAG